MKNYFVKANRNFTDKEENTYRNSGDTFYCTEERYNYLINCNNAVELIKKELIDNAKKIEKDTIKEIEKNLKKISKKKNK